MALLGDKMLSEDDEISDGVDSLEEGGSSDEILSQKLLNQVIKEQAKNKDASVEATTAVGGSSESIDSGPSFYEQMDDFTVPDEAIGKVGNIGDGAILKGVAEGFVSLRKVRLLKGNAQIELMLQQMEKRRKRIDRMMKTAPF